MKLRWTLAAKADLLDFFDYIAADKPEAAKAWVAKLRRRAEQASEYPNSGRVVPELRRQEIREIIEKGYRIVYRVQDAETQILAAVESHRRLRSLPSEDG